jgi:16S rRNA (cytidine1402-2'-O)-methyltransferase
MPQQPDGRNDKPADRPPPGLYVVATPIGNLGDISARALATLRAADLILAEDTRVTAKLLARYAIQRPMLSFHEHSANRLTPELVSRLEHEVIALVSDAGTPLISDPGDGLVAAARAAGRHVSTAPGPSAVIAALSVCGLHVEHFLFHGFLPAKSAERRLALRGLAGIPAALVFFESPQRLAACLADAADTLGDRPAAICRELTKLHEEVTTGHLKALALAQTAAPKGEIVLVIGPPEAQDAPVLDPDSLLREALQRLSVKAAVAEVAALTGLPRSDIYSRALAIKQSND